MAIGENLVREIPLVAAKKEWLGGIQATTTVFMVCSAYTMNIYVVPGTVFGSRPGCGLWCWKVLKHMTPLGSVKS